MSERPAVLGHRYYSSFLCGFLAGTVATSPEWWWLAFLPGLVGALLAFYWHGDETRRSAHLQHVLGLKADELDRLERR